MSINMTPDEMLAEIQRLRLIITGHVDFESGLVTELTKRNNDLNCKTIRINELNNALRLAEKFTIPEITRGPAVADWVKMRSEVEKVIDTNPVWDDAECRWVYK